MVSIFLLPRKEVIQPQIPLRLPCYDFITVVNLTFSRKIILRDSGTTNFHNMTGGVYNTRERIHRGMLIHDY
jgi:hypothetical protein